MSNLKFKLKLKEVVLNDDDYLKTFLIDINSAKNTIDLEVYIFETDSVGKIVTDALCNAAKRGVKIRVLVDGVGSISWGGELAAQMELAGIETRVFHPLPWKFMHWRRTSFLPHIFIQNIFYLLSRINSRNHRKVCILDKNIVYVGSANISDKAWRETTVKLINVNINDIQYAFDKAWGNPLIKKNVGDIFKKSADPSSFLLNYSWRLRHRYYSKLMKRISNCKKRIWVTNSYFVPDSRLLKKLIKASLMGIDVRILLPGESDLIYMSLVSTTFYSDLLKSGVLIYEYKPKILHAKILILDDWITVGSNNLNYRSFLHDLEVGVKIRSCEAQSVIEQQFMKDINQARQIQSEDLKSQFFFKKMIGRFILLVRYWL